MSWTCPDCGKQNDTATCYGIHEFKDGLIRRRPTELDIVRSELTRTKAALEVAKETLIFMRDHYEIDVRARLNANEAIGKITRLESEGVEGKDE